MRRIMRSVLVALLVTMLTISPAAAHRYCGSCGGGYYASNYYSGYYDSCGGSSGCYDCGYASSCCGGEVVVSDGCGGCADCGCEASAECSDCSTADATMEAHPPANDQPPMKAPEPPVMAPQPSTVNRPAVEPVPTLPPEPMPGASGTEMDALPSTPAPPAERYAPSTEVAPPATDPALPPADSSNDLFGEPATSAPATSAPATSEPARVEQPLPVETPATPPQADDLFGPPAETSSTDAPGAPGGASPASTPPPSDDDLFGPPSDGEPAEEATPPADEKKTEEADDLFGKSQAILELPGGLASNAMRLWVDNTGNYSVRGRLIRVLDGNVQLLKDTGRTTTVPMNRLSQADFAFVTRQASAQKSEAVSKTAQVTSGWSN